MSSWSGSRPLDFPARSPGVTSFVTGRLILHSSGAGSGKPSLGMESRSTSSSGSSLMALVLLGGWVSGTDGGLDVRVGPQRAAGPEASPLTCEYLGGERVRPPFDRHAAGRSACRSGGSAPRVDVPVGPADA